MTDRASRTTDFISMNELLNITPPDASTKEKIETANEQKKLIRKEEEMLRSYHENRFSVSVLGRQLGKTSLIQIIQKG